MEDTQVNYQKTWEEAEEFARFITEQMALYGWPEEEVFSLHSSLCSLLHEGHGKMACLVISAIYYFFQGETDSNKGNLCGEEFLCNDFADVFTDVMLERIQEFDFEKEDLNV